MDEKLKPYLLAALICHITDRQTLVDKSYLNRDETLKQISTLLDGMLPAHAMEWAFEDLSAIGIFTKITDDLAGDFYKLNSNPAVNEVARQSNDEDSLIYKYRSVGPRFLSAVVDRIGRPDADRSKRMPLDAVSVIPGSDRLVSLTHNQVSSFDEQISELVEELETHDNGDPDHPGLRERLLGQVKAGRELIRAGEFRAFLIYEVLVRALSELIEKYSNPTVKALANALLGAIVSQVLEG